jgi:hypothetical protein
MAIIANIVVNDGASTPVERTLSPSGQAVQENGTKVMYLDKSAAGGIAVGFPELHLIAMDVVGTKPVTRYKVKAVYPVLETISNNTASGYAPAPQRAYFLQYEGTWTMPKRSTLVDRETFQGLIANLYDNATVQSMLRNFDPPV